MGNLGDVETEGESGILQLIKTKPSRFEGVITGNRLSGNPVAENGNQHEMSAKLAAFVEVEGIHRRKDPARLSTDPGLLEEFPYGGRFYRLARLDLAAGKAPTAGIRRIGPTYQKNPAFMEDSGDRGGNWRGYGTCCRHVGLFGEAGKGGRRLDLSLRRHDPDQVQRVTVLPFGQQYLSPLAGHPSVVRTVANTIP